MHFQISPPTVCLQPFDRCRQPFDRCLQPFDRWEAYTVRGFINILAVVIFSSLFALPSSSVFCLLSELRQSPKAVNVLFTLQSSVFSLLSSLRKPVTVNSDSFLRFSPEEEEETLWKMMPITLEDLRSGSPALCGDFNRIKQDVIQSVGDNENLVLELLTERILMEFLQFHSRKRQHLQLHSKKRKRLEEPSENNKKLVLRIIPPKNPADFAPNNYVNIKQKQEKEVKFKKNKRQRKNPVETKQEVLVQPACMPTEFILKVTDLKGFEIKLVIQKQLTETDMKTSQDRLSIPRGQMKYDFLTMEEQICLEEKEADGIHFKGLQVPLVEPSLVVSTIFLKRWKLGSSNTYMLSNPWINVAKRNGLKAGNTIQIWSFRVNQRPHLALINLSK